MHYGGHMEILRINLIFNYVVFIVMDGIWMIHRGWNGIINSFVILYQFVG